MSEIDQRIGARIRALRGPATLDALAAASGVSRAMLSRIEHGQSSATAQLLNRLAGGLGVTLSALVAEEGDAKLRRRAAQPVWQDPGSGYTRRAVSGPGGLTEIVEVTLPPGASVAFDNAQVAAVGQQLWVLAGGLHVTLGQASHRLAAGDCLAMRFGEPVRFHNPTRRTTRYAVILERARA